MILHRFMLETSQGICDVYFIVYAWHVAQDLILIVFII